MLVRLLIFAWVGTLAPLAVLAGLDPFQLPHVSSMSYALCIKHFNNYGDFEKWLDDWTILKDVRFFWKSIHKFPERWGKYVTSDGAYLE